MFTEEGLTPNRELKERKEKEKNILDHFVHKEKVEKKFPHTLVPMFTLKQCDYLK